MQQQQQQQNVTKSRTGTKFKNLLKIGYRPKCKIKIIKLEIYILKSFLPYFK